MLKCQKINTVLFGGNAAADQKIVSRNDGSGSFLAIKIAVPTNFQSGEKEEVLFIEATGGSRHDIEYYTNHPILKGDTVYIQGYIKNIELYDRADKTVGSTLKIGIDSISSVAKDRANNSAPANNQPPRNAGF